MILNTQPYDPDAPEGSSSVGTSQLVSKREFRYMILTFFCVLLLLVPVFFRMRENSWQTGCLQNMKAISAAITGYATDADGYFPLPYAPDSNGEPRLEEGVVSWVTAIQPYMNQRKNFICPASKEDEATKNQGKSDDGPFVRSTYGLVPGVVAQPNDSGGFSPISKEDISDPTNVALIVETSNGGAQNTYNPLPLCKASACDGILAGYQKGNFAPDIGKTEKSDFMTRLAFYGTKDGRFEGDEIKPRHPIGLHVIFVDGNFGVMQPKNAFIRRDGSGRPLAPWWPANNRNFAREE